MNNPGRPRTSPGAHNTWHRTTGPHHTRQRPSRHHLSVQSEPQPEPQVHDDDNEEQLDPATKHQNWKRKRTEFINNIKCGYNYRLVSERKRRGPLTPLTANELPPGTPDPDDMDISKRNWENQTKTWRCTIRSCASSIRWYSLVRCYIKKVRHDSAQTSVGARLHFVQ